MGDEWGVYPGDSIPDATCGAGVGDAIYVHEGANALEYEREQANHADRQWRRCGDGAGGRCDGSCPWDVMGK